MEGPDCTGLVVVQVVLRNCLEAAVLDYIGQEEDTGHPVLDKANGPQAGRSLEVVGVGSILADNLDSLAVVVLDCNLVARKVAVPEGSHLVAGMESLI